MDRISNLFSSVRDVVSGESENDVQDVWERANAHMSSGANSSGKVKGALLALLAVSGGALVMQRESISVSDVAAGRLYDGSTLDSSCVQGLVFGGVGSVLLHDPWPFALGATGCFSGVGAQQRIRNEFLVNTITTGNQSNPSAAAFSNGNFVIVWESYLQDGDGEGIYGQLFDDNGDKIGSEFHINNYTTSNQRQPSTSTFNNGNFVVTWSSNGQDGSSYGVYGQLFEGNGIKIGNEFLANTYTIDAQHGSSVTSLINRNFVVAWHSNGQDGSGYGIYGQLFYSNATKKGNEFQVNTYTANQQQDISVAGFDNGNFVVTWESYIQDGDSFGIYGQLFDENATKIGNEFLVNTYVQSEQGDPSVASFSGGNFVVTWESYTQDGSGYGVYGQLFDGNANGVGVEFLINTYTTDHQVYPSVASFSNGNFVVIWHSNGQDGSSFGIYGQLFFNNATKVENEFQVNTYTNLRQRFPYVVGFDNGNFIVVWESNGQDGSSFGIYGQLFEWPIITSSTTSSTSEVSTTSISIIDSTTSSGFSTTSGVITESSMLSTTSEMTYLSSNVISSEVTSSSIPSTKSEETSGDDKNNKKMLAILLPLAGVCLLLVPVIYLFRRKKEDDISNEEESLELSRNKKSNDYAEFPKNRSSESPYANHPEDTTPESYANAPKDSSPYANNPQEGSELTEDYANAPT